MGGMHPALAAMLTETIQHAAYTGQDAYGTPTHGPLVARPARIEYEVTILPGTGGAQRTSTTKVFCDGDFSVSVRDRIVLPDGTAPAIQAVQTWYDPTRTDWLDHLVILL